MEWMILPLRRYFRFSARSRRKEFWMFILFTILLSIVAALIDLLLGYGSTNAMAQQGVFSAGFRSNGPVGAIVSLLLLIPSFTVSARRLHDTDRSAWWLLLSFIPLIGWIALLIFYCQDGTRGENRFGADPKAEHVADVFA